MPVFLGQISEPLFQQTKESNGAHTMDRSTALRILGIYDVMPEEIRKRYRELMKKHHPDVSGDPALSLQKAQQITEAYRFLKAEGILRQSQNSHDWGIHENKTAFMERPILMEESLYGSALTVDTGISGRFYWDPELESFQIFMKSVHTAVDHIIEREEDRLTEDQAAHLRLRLFHLLLQEFVDPCETIRMLFPPVAEERNTIVCHVPCDIRPVTKSAAFLPIPETSVVTARNSRLFLSVCGKEAFTVTFQVNACYYIITPMILQRAAQAVFVPASANTKKPGSRYASGKLIITVNEEKKKDPTGRINEEIRRLLAL